MPTLYFDIDLQQQPPRLAVNSTTEPGRPLRLAPTTTAATLQAAGPKLLLALSELLRELDGLIPMDALGTDSRLAAVLRLIVEAGAEATGKDAAQLLEETRQWVLEVQQ